MRSAMSLKVTARSALVSSEQMQLENRRFVMHVDLGFSISLVRPEDSIIQQDSTRKKGEKEKRRKGEKERNGW